MQLVLVAQDEEKDYSLARVGEKIYGVYIFVNAKPYYKYQYIATVSVKLNWSGTRYEAFQKAIKKAKKKYPYFNGMIFQSSGFDKVDLINFEGLEVSRGGHTIGSKVSFIDEGKLYYGEIIELGSSKGKGSIKYINKLNEETIIKLPYSDLTPISEEDFQAKVKKAKTKISNSVFAVGNKVSWKIFQNFYYGEIISINNNTKKASVKTFNKYGDESISNIYYSKLTKLLEGDFIQKENERKKELEQHKFIVGEEVTWVKNNPFGTSAIEIKGTIVDLDDASHKASVRYKNSEGDDKILKVDYIDLNKIVLGNQ